MSDLVQVRGLCKSFPDGSETRPVLVDFHLQAAPGEVVALMGPSGSGKTTLLNVLAGMLRADAGSVRLQLDGKQIDLSAQSGEALTRLRRRYIGYVFQFHNLIPTLTVRENVLLPLELNRLGALTEEAMARLEGLGLADRLNDFPGSLSGGERQRTAIARALAHRPVLVLADEPTGNLDRENAERVVHLLIREVRTLSSALLMATHSEVVAGQADRVLRLDLPGMRETG